jgi:hypothetical protein
LTAGYAAGDQLGGDRLHQAIERISVMGLRHRGRLTLHRHHHRVGLVTAEILDCSLTKFPLNNSGRICRFASAVSGESARMSPRRGANRGSHIAVRRSDYRSAHVARRARGRAASVLLLQRLGACHQDRAPDHSEQPQARQ